MDYVTTCENLAASLHNVPPDDPLVAAALTFAIQPWLNGVHQGPELMRWGPFAVGVQGVTDRLWPEPATIALAPCTPPPPGPQLDSAAARLVTTVADLLDRASRHPSDALAWEYAAASTELRDAAKELV